MEDMMTWVVDVKSTYSFSKLEKKLNGIAIEALNTLANGLNADIQKNIDNSRDVDGKSFTSMRESTVNIRKRRGDGTKVLHRNPSNTYKGANKGILRNTHIERPTPSNLSFEIQMTGKWKGTTYGVLHNEGFTTSSKSMIPGKRVPARKWFGITKDFREKGQAYINTMKLANTRIKTAMKK